MTDSDSEPPYKYQVRADIAGLVARDDDEIPRTRLSKRTLAAVLLALEDREYTNEVLIRRTEADHASIYELQENVARAAEADVEPNQDQFTKDQLLTVRDALRASLGGSRYEGNHA